MDIHNFAATIARHHVPLSRLGHAGARVSEPAGISSYMGDSSRQGHGRQESPEQGAAKEVTAKTLTSQGPVKTIPSAVLLEGLMTRSPHGQELRARLLENGGRAA